MNQSVKNLGGILVTFAKGLHGIDVTIEGDKLDTYPDLATAERYATEFIKQLKGTK